MCKLLKLRPRFREYQEFVSQRAIHEREITRNEAAGVRRGDDTFSRGAVPPSLNTFIGRVSIIAPEVRNFHARRLLGDALNFPLDEGTTLLYIS